MGSMINVATYNRKRKLQRLWVLPLAVALFLATSVSVYAFITGFNFVQVGQAIYTYFSVGSGVFTSYTVGGYSTNAQSNSLAQNVLPIIGAVAIILYALKNVGEDSGLTGLVRTAFILIIGAIMLTAVVVILSQLT